MLLPASQPDIESFLQNHPNWSFEEDRLKQSVTLVDFDTAMRVVEKVAEVARAMDHHPLWTNVYTRLSFSLCTHRVGDKVTKLDFELAERISDILSEV
jgi:4a-hydroxytetrahydrobiopterin dehydratase